ncbi:hypothetical protein RHMOL_Rhmol09G0061300 [Rhododendron molle]|uniref:Uncharacterized protein n=1 Tax=Rhododendron molle TaxID=49168 RepID=A0ACC0MAY9_RHOML|nr:hypothetical protein RHMOL_Rhmol09G0061300 [Rhododendron molle]
MVTSPPIETTAAAKLIWPTVVTNQANRRRPGHNGMTATAEVAEQTALAVGQMLASLPPLPPPGETRRRRRRRRRRPSLRHVLRRRLLHQYHESHRRVEERVVNVRKIICNLACYRIV